MDLAYTEEEREFQAEVREFLTKAVPPDIARKTMAEVDLEKHEQDRWHAILNERGWLGYMWPEEYGGTGWGPVKQHIFETEMARANAPRVVPFSMKMLGPVLMKFGSAEQCSYWLPRMLDGSDYWCQGYSEPGAGSDLASLKTTAVRDGDHYVVNGQKTWTTVGHHANMIFCLVRTSTTGKPQQGISFLLVDMNSPGIEVRPIKLIEGGHEVNEIFFTDVKVPVENLVGEENKGWTYAKFLLEHERVSIANVGAAQAKLDRLKALANSQKRKGRPLAEDPLFAARLARVEIELKNLETTNLRVLQASANGGKPGPESSMLKIVGSEIMQELDHLTRRALGRHAQAYTPEVYEAGQNAKPVVPADMAGATPAYFNNRKLTIYGGSNEIQKNVISKAILGL